MTKNIVPLLSVCFITYNHEKFIRQSLDSVLTQQANFLFEIVIGEDCSTDKTREIVFEYQKKHPDIIRVVTDEINVGPQNNVVRTLKACRGKYVATLEGDDYWTDFMKLQKQVDFLEHHPEFVGTFHDCIILNTADGSTHLRIGNTPIDEEPDLESNIIQKNQPTASLVFRNILDNDFFPDWIYCINNFDYALIILLARFGKFKYFKDPMSVYRIHLGGIWSSKNRLYTKKQDIILYKLLETLSEDLKVIRAIRVKQKWVNYKFSIELVKARCFTRSISYLFRSILIRDSDLRLQHGGVFEYLLVLGSTIKSMVIPKNKTTDVV